MTFLEQHGAGLPLFPQDVRAFAAAALEAAGTVNRLMSHPADTVELALALLHSGVLMPLDTFMSEDVDRIEAQIRLERPR